MSHPVRYERAAPQSWDPPRYCEYCGASLDPQYYFCRTCATPYADADSVAPRPVPKRLTDGELVARKAPHVWPMFWTYVAVVLAPAVLCHVAFGGQRPTLTLVIQSMVLFVTTCIYAAVHWPSLAVQLRRFGLLTPAAFWGLAALVPLLAVNALYHLWLVHYVGADPSTLIDELRASGLGEVGLVFLLCVLPAVTEEIAFRGLVQHWLHVALRPRSALVLASALFAALHFSVLTAPYLFALGVVMGWTKWRTGSLYPAMLIHFLHNFVVVEFLA